MGEWEMSKLIYNSFSLSKFKKKIAFQLTEQIGLP